uniref:recombinase RecT n=1 Tax=Salmonella enterica TaxID=28901 RepID=UPI0015C4BD19
QTCAFRSTMRIDAIHSIRDRSEAWKKYKVDNSKKCPWVTDEEQMILKTVVKQAAKYWPRRERLDAAIDHVNTEGEEGINFAAERQPERDITPVSDETMREINDLLITLNKTWDDDLLPLCSKIFRRDIGASSDLTQIEAVKALGFLKQKAAEQKVEA